MYQLTSQELLNIDGGATINGYIMAPHHAIKLVCNLIKSIFK